MIKIEQQMEYNTYKFLDHKSKAKPLNALKKIRFHFVYHVKHNRRHKVILLVNFHLTDITLSRVYSGLLSLKVIRLVLFLEKVNVLEA